MDVSTLISIEMFSYKEVYRQIITRLAQADPYFAVDDDFFAVVCTLLPCGYQATAEHTLPENLVEEAVLFGLFGLGVTHLAQGLTIATASPAPFSPVKAAMICLNYSFWGLSLRSSKTACQAMATIPSAIADLSLKTQSLQRTLLSDAGLMVTDPPDDRVWLHLWRVGRLGYWLGTAWAVDGTAVSEPVDALSGSLAGLLSSLLWAARVSDGAIVRRYRHFACCALDRAGKEIHRLSHPQVVEELLEQARHLLGT